MGKYGRNRYLDSEKFYNTLGVGVIVAGLFLIASLGIINKAHAEDNFVKQAVNPVVQLERNCSGVIIDIAKDYAEFKDRTYLVTANHCVVKDAKPEDEPLAKDKSGRVTIDDKDGGQILGTTQYVYDVVGRDTVHDLAVLRLRKDGLHFPGATISKRDPKLGEQVWTIGYAMGLPNRGITDGHFGGFMSIENSPTDGITLDYTTSNGTDKYQASPAIAGGNSGGGMFLRDGDDYLFVGTTDIGFPRFPDSGFYNTQGEINELVDHTLKSEKLTADEKAKAVKEDPKKHD